MTCADTPTTMSSFPWEESAAGLDEDEDEEEEEEDAPPEDTDVPYERLCEPRFGPGPDVREVTMDGVLDDLTKSQVRAKLRSADFAGDIFALGSVLHGTWSRRQPKRFARPADGLEGPATSASRTSGRTSRPRPGTLGHLLALLEHIDRGPTERKRDIRRPRTISQECD